jgi:hypothetical protein
MMFLNFNCSQDFTVLSSDKTTQRCNSNLEEKIMKSRIFVTCILSPLFLFVAGCQTTPVQNTAGTPTTYQDPGTRGAVSGVGIESQDIVSMTDKMSRDMLGDPVFVGSKGTPRIIIDSKFFSNESSERINKNIITDRLRIGLNRVSKGRMQFVGREYSGMVEKERDLKRAGKVDTATRGLTRAQAGADFRLGGRISSLDARNASTGQISRYNQITFEMVDLENGLIVWSGIYEFSKSAQDNIVYR